MKRFAPLLFAGALFAGTPLFAAAPVFSNQFVSVTLDGVRLGTDTDPSNYSMFPSVVYDPSSGLFHMWVANTDALTIEGLRHATSSDGVHFVSDGSLSFSGGNPFPAYGAATEPQFEFPRAAKIGDDWKLLIWTENAQVPGQYGDYNYNESVNDIGIDPSTLAVTHEGPVYPTNGLGTFGQTTGPYGIVNGRLYVQDDRIGGLSKWEYVDAAPPSVTPPADTYQDLITGTGYVYFLTHPGDPLGVYVHNVARVLEQGDGTLGVYYALRHPDGSRVNKQIYYAQSGDGGQTWSTPAGLFSNGDAVRVDGAPNQFDFSHPEVTLVGSRRVLYFSTKAADGAFVVATSAGQAASVNSWADLLGSEQGAGESGRAVTRTSGGGYAVAGNTAGFGAGAPAVWLVRLDGTGEVVWQKVYRFGSGPVVNALTQTPDGGLVMAGTMGAGAATWVLQVDALGSVVWGNTYATSDPSLGGLFSEGNALIVTADGGLAIAGRVAGYFGLMKLDAGGTLQWIHAYPAGAAGGADETSAVGLAENLPGGGIAAVGTWSSGGLARILFADSAGGIFWEKTVGSDQRPPSGIVAGQGPFFAVTGNVANAPWALQIDISGNVSWQNTYSAQGASAIVATDDGQYAIATSASQATLFEIEDGQGSPVWGKKFGAQTSSLSSFHGVALTHDAGFLAVGEDVAGTDSRLLAVKVDSGGEFVGCLDVETSVPIQANPTQLATADVADAPVDEAANTTVSPLSVTAEDTDAAERVICRGSLPAELAPAALAADPAGNGVADPGERFVVAPSWENEGLTATLLTGHTSIVSDTNGLDTSDPDVDASYGAVASLATSDCQTATGDCYQFGFQNVPRPSQHWDTSFDETLSTSDPHHKWAKRWTVHAGLSFSDVSPASGFYSFIEDIFHNGITGGCGAGIYCPTNSVTRAQMSVFLLKSKHGAAFVPPPCQGIFGDVACPSLFADWIEELAAEGITAGCSTSPLLYCPDSPVTRQQMSAFLLKSLNGSGYVPPPASGIFGDVPVANLFAPWIEDLYNRQITAGCSASPLLYCPSDPNTRQQMAVFLTKTFSLVLYGP
jgi:hypothetical protein